MTESLLAVGIGLALAAGATLLVLARAELLLGAGLLLVWIGLLVGLPAGVVYHVALYRVLAHRGALGPRWWLRPTSFHGQLDPAGRRRVMRWFRVGAAGFLAIVIGAALATAGALRAR